MTNKQIEASQKDMDEQMRDLNRDIDDSSGEDDTSSPTTDPPGEKYGVHLSDHEIGTSH